MVGTLMTRREMGGVLYGDWRGWEAGGGVEDMGLGKVGDGGVGRKWREGEGKGRRAWERWGLTPVGWGWEGVRLRDT